MIESLIVLMAQPGEGGGGLMSTLVMFALIFLIFYFMIIRPQQRRQKERQKMLDSLQKGDKVITSGGLHGTIVGIEDKTLLIQIADNVKVKIERGSVAGVPGGEIEKT